MTATETIHADHARSAGQIEGVIGALAAIAPDHLACVQALQRQALDDMDQQARHGRADASDLPDGVTAVCLMDGHAVALIRDGYRYRLAVRRLRPHWREIVGRAVGACGPGGWHVAGAAGRVTRGPDYQTAGDALGGQALQVSGRDARLWLVHQHPGGDGAPRLVLDVLDGGALRAALADGSTVMLTC